MVGSAPPSIFQCETCSEQSEWLPDRSISFNEKSHWVKDYYVDFQSLYFFYQLP